MNKKKYINEIADRTCLPYKYRKKIKKDFTQEFDSMLAQGYSEDEVMKLMGDADTIAADIYESYIEGGQNSRPFIEYKSNKTVFGMPFIHIVKTKRRSYVRGFNDERNRYIKVPTAKGFIAIGRKAKGVIAIGNLSCGVISIGNLSIGLISITNIGLGLLSLGNLALGLFIALGNLAIGGLSMGNGAIGYAALGNAALGKYAIGNAAYGYHSIVLDIPRNIQAGQEIYNSSISLFTSSIMDFISSTPPFVQSFFNMGIAAVQNIIQRLDLLLYSFGIVLVLIVAAGIFISNWIESRAKKYQL